MGPGPGNTVMSGKGWRICSHQAYSVKERHTSINNDTNGCISINGENTLKERTSSVRATAKEPDHKSVQESFPGEVRIELTFEEWQGVCKGRGEDSKLQRQKDRQEKDRGEGEVQSRDGAGSGRRVYNWGRGVRRCPRDSQRVGSAEGPLKVEMGLAGRRYPSHTVGNHIRDVDLFLYIIFILLFLAILRLHCCTGCSLVAARGAALSFQGAGFSLQWLLLLQSMGSRARGLQ